MRFQRKDSSVYPGSTCIVVCTQKGMYMARTSLWNNTNLWVFSWASFLSDMSFGATSAILPAFFVSLTDTSSAPLYIGLASAGAETVSYISTLLAGWFSAHYGYRKPMIYSGYAYEGILTACIALISYPWHAVVVRSLSRIGQGMRRPTRASSLAASIAEDQYGTAFGIHQGIDKAGGIFGLCIAMWAISQLSYYAMFMWASVPMFLATISIYVWMRHPQSHKHDSATDYAHVTTNLFMQLPASFWVFIAVMGVFSIAQIPASTVLLRSYNAETMMTILGDRYAITLYVVYTVARTMGGYCAGALSNMLGPLPIITWGGFAGFTVATSAMVLDISQAMYGIPLMFIFGLSTMTITTIELSVIPRMLPQHLQDIGYGVLYITRGIGMLLAGWAVGMLWSTYTAWHAFAYMVSISSISTLLIILYNVYIHNDTSQ